MGLHDQIHGETPLRIPKTAPCLFSKSRPRIRLGEQNGENDFDEHHRRQIDGEEHGQQESRREHEVTLPNGR